MIEDAMSTAMAGASKAGGGARQPMDRAALAALVNASADYTSKAIAHPRYSQPVQDPAFFPVARPQNTLLGENGGARYATHVRIDPPVLAEAGPTQGNGRKVGGAGRRQPFWGGSSD